MSSQDAALARVEERLAGLVEQVARLTETVDAMREAQAELRGALRFARMIAGISGATGIGGLAAWWSSITGGGSPPHQ